MSNDHPKSDIYKGVCIVNAYYTGMTTYSANIESSHSHQDTYYNDSKELKQFSRIPNTCNDNKLTHDFIHDFNNFFPEKHRILRGCGYIKTINNIQYVITCNHIMIHYASYIGYSTDIANNIVKFDMTVYHRIPEIDIVIMKISTHLKNPLSNLHVVTKLKTLYESSENNVLVTGKFIHPTPQNPRKSIIFKTLNLNHEVRVVFDILISKHIHHIPLLNLPVCNMEVIKKIALDQKMNEQRHVISNIIAEQLSGTSGSIVRSNNSNIGMCCLYTDTLNGTFLKAIPLFFIDLVVNNAINLGYKNLMGVQLDTYHCDIKFQNTQMYSHYVVQQSCTYVNDKRSCLFKKGDVILEVDGKQFDNNMMIYCDYIDMKIPMNAYLMIKSNMNPEIPISIKSAKQYHNNTKISIYNLSCIPFNDMFYSRICSNTHYRWHDMIFMELSEDLILFYKRMGIDIVNNININDTYTTNNKKTIILFNYKKEVFKSHLTKEYYTSMPYIGQTGHYFYTVNLLGNKKILNMNDLICTLDTTILRGRKQLTFNLYDDIGITQLLIYHII